VGADAFAISTRQDVVSVANRIDHGRIIRAAEQCD